MSVSIGGPCPSQGSCPKGSSCSKACPPNQPKKVKPVTVDSLKRKARREYKKALKEKDEKAAADWKKVIDAQRINISGDGAWQVALDGPKEKCWKCEQENYPLEDVDKFWGYECSCGIRYCKTKDSSEKLNKYFPTGY